MVGSSQIITLGEREGASFQVSSFIIFTLFTEQIQLNNIIYSDTGMKIQIKG